MTTTNQGFNEDDSPRAAGSHESFRRSSFCNGGKCVEVAVRQNGGVKVRDGKHPNEGNLDFTSDEWRAFVNGVKHGEFDV